MGTPIVEHASKHFALADAELCRLLVERLGLRDGDAQLSMNQSPLAIGWLGS